MKPQFTTGGWNRNIKPVSKYPTVFAGRNTHIAVVASQGLEAEVAEANCDLIAAAPDLFGALADALEALKRLPDVEGAFRVTCIAQAEQTLRKAMGGATA
jgi:hypothetical protein